MLCPAIERTMTRLIIELALGIARNAGADERNEILAKPCNGSNEDRFFLPFFQRMMKRGRMGVVSFMRDR